MDNILTYILQVNLLLAIVFVSYQFLLKNLTFYKLNRVYLLVGAIYALVYPFINIKSWFQESVSMVLPEMSSFVDLSAFQEVEDFFSVYDLLLIVFGLGFLFFLSKLIIQLVSLFRIHLYSKPSQWRDYLFRNVIFPIAPFSFFNKVYLHQAQHQELELEDIFEHEYIHVKGRHTIDILLFEILLIGCWYNPFVWLMRKSVRQNLEFLTDHKC